MVGKEIRSYRKQDKNGKLITVFVYAVSGTDKELEQYRELQGENLRESDDGELLWFTTRYAGPRANLIFTKKSVTADMSAFDKAKSLSEQYGGNFGDALAAASVAGLLGAKPVSQAPQEKPETEEEQAVPKKGKKG